jgi:hypothetical protein
VQRKSQELLAVRQQQQQQQAPEPDEKHRVPSRTGAQTPPAGAVAPGKPAAVPLKSAMAAAKPPPARAPPSGSGSFRGAAALQGGGVQVLRGSVRGNKLRERRGGVSSSFTELQGQITTDAGVLPGVTTRVRRRRCCCCCCCCCRCSIAGGGFEPRSWPARPPARPPARNCASPPKLPPPNVPPGCRAEAHRLWSLQTGEPRRVLHPGRAPRYT